MLTVRRSEVPRQGLGKVLGVGGGGSRSGLAKLQLHQSALQQAQKAKDGDARAQPPAPAPGRDLPRLGRLRSDAAAAGGSNSVLCLGLEPLLPGSKSPDAPPPHQEPDGDSGAGARGERGLEAERSARRPRQWVGSSGGRKPGPAPTFNPHSPPGPTCRFAFSRRRELGRPNHLPPLRAASSLLPGPATFTTLHC